ncbi:ABC transporter substrate-binding protein [Microbacterium marmarense]|uniref:ABC transporter substrate-binding protein n=1 Tax=Microbacterium marmarense TaxID=3122051 RepID=A0ABU8LQW6_9MICO
MTWPEPTTDLTGVELTMWAAQASATIADGVIADFEDETGAKVDVVVVPDPYAPNVLTKLATGDKPDLMFWQSTLSVLNSIRADETLQDLSTAPWISALNETNKNVGVVDGVHYAAVVQPIGTIGIYYNKQAFEEAGITEIPTAYDEVIDAAESLKDAGIASPIYEAGGAKWPTQYAVQGQLSGLIEDGLWDDMNKNEASFADPDIVEIISDYNEIFTSGLGNENYQTATFDDQNTALYNGDAGMVMGGPSTVNALVNNYDGADLDERVGYFAAGPSGPIALQVGGQENTVVAPKSGDETRETATRQFLSYWTGPAYADYLDDKGYLSAQTDVPSPDSATQLAETVNNWPSTQLSMQEGAVANPDLYINLASMLVGTATPEQVGQQTASQFSQIASAQGIPGF